MEGGRAPVNPFSRRASLSPNARPTPAAHLSDPVGIDLRRRVMLRMSRHGSPPLAQELSPFAFAALSHRSLDHRGATTRDCTTTCHNTAPFLFSCLPSFLLHFCSARPKSVQPDSNRDGDVNDVNNTENWRNVKPNLAGRNADRLSLAGQRQSLLKIARRRRKMLDREEHVQLTCSVGSGLDQTRIGVSCECCRS